jgi:hypothetical protein
LKAFRIKEHWVLGFFLKTFRIKEPPVLGFGKLSEAKHLWFKVFEKFQRTSGF